MSDSPLPAEAADHPHDASPERVPPHPKLIWFLVVPIIGFIIASYVGDALAPAWVEDHPLALIALNSRNRNLVLATNNLDAISYYGVATIRLLASDPLFYLIGFFYGDRAIGWVEKKSKTYGPMMRGFERFFAKAAYPMVVIAPNNPICLLAGSAGMRPAIFLSLNLFGTIVRLYLIRLFGEQFDAPIQTVLDFIAEYRIYLLALSFGSFGWVIFRDVRGAKDSDLGTLIKGAKEISEDGDAADSAESDGGAPGSHA